MPNNKFMAKYLKALIIVGLFLSLLTVGRAVAAQSVYVDLNSAEAAAGYVLKQDNFELEIKPQVLSEPATVVFKELGQDYPALNGYDRISDIYQYDVRLERPRILDQRLFAKIKFDSTKSNSKQIYAWDRAKSKWLPLPTGIDWDKKEAVTEVPFPFLNIALFENPHPYREQLRDTGQPGLSARAAVSIDAQTGEVLYQKDATRQHSMASLTKMMTALVFLEHNPGWQKGVTMAGSDNVGGATVGLNPGEVVSVRDLFATMLVGSRNNAAMALVRASGLSTGQFVAAMNDKAAQLGLAQTHFEEPTGLSAGNMTSALDYAKLSRKALEHSEIRWFSSLPLYGFSTKNTHRALSVNNTNKMVRGPRPSIGGKTGFTYEAGYCLMTWLKEEPGRSGEIISVVLGDPNYASIFSDTERLTDWVFDAYQWNL